MCTFYEENLTTFEKWMKNSAKVFIKKVDLILEIENSKSLALLNIKNDDVDIQIRAKEKLNLILKG
jgi:hypothetical protein